MVESGPHGAVLSCGVVVFFFSDKKFWLDFFFFLRDRRGYSNHVDLRYLGRRAEISRGVNGRRVFCPDFCALAANSSGTLFTSSPTT